MLPQESKVDVNLAYTKEYTVRRDILNMTQSNWEKLGDDRCYTGTAKSFFDCYGLVGGATFNFNSEEREFFDLLYKYEREVVRK